MIGMWSACISSDRVGGSCEDECTAAHREIVAYKRAQLATYGGVKETNGLIVALRDELVVERVEVDGVDIAHVTGESASW